MAASDKKLQSFYAFNAGEYSKDLAGRTDLESFGSSTRYTSNFLTQVSGGLKKFYGTRHITEQSVSNFEIKLIPFVNKYEPMVLVVYGDDTITSDDGLSVGLIYGDSYKDLSIKLPRTIKVNEMRWQQVNDKIILCHRTMQPIEINFYGVDEDNDYIFNAQQISFKEIPYFPIGYTGDYSGSLTASGISGNVTLTIPTGTALLACRYVSPLDTEASYVRSTYYLRDDTITIGSSTVTINRVRGGNVSILCSGTCNTPYIEPLGSGVVQSLAPHGVKDTITKERILQVVQGTYPGSYIDGSNIVFKNMNDHQSGDGYYMQLSVGAITVAGQVRHQAQTLTSSIITPQATTTATINADALLGRKIKFFFNENTVIEPWYQGKTVNEGAYVYSNGHYYKAVSAGNNQTCGNIQPSHTFGIVTDGTVQWLYVHSGSKTATVIGVPSSTSIKVLVDGGELPKNGGNVYNNYAWSIWGKDDVHPSEVYMVGNRLGFVCNTLNYGSWNAMSVTDDYFNFSTEEYGEQLDTSAIVHLVGNNESSDINWVLARSDVYMGGYSGEYHLASGSQNKRGGAYTPTTTYVQNISNVGGKAVVPLKYKELNMFVGLTGKELYTVAYDYTIDDYMPRSLGYLTQHIMDKGIKRMVALNNLDRNIYLLHDTNELSLFNYAAEQKVMGFTELNFGDEVIDFCSTYAKDDVAGYVVIKRNTGKITIERFCINNPNYMFDEITQGNGTLADFQPIPHFANRTVYIRYGDDFSQFTKVTLDANGDVSHDPLTGVYVPQSKYFKVGIPMVSELHTQPAFGNKVDGHQQQSLYMYMRLVNSGAFEYGSSVDFSKYFRHEYWNTQQEYGSEHRVFTGDLKLEIPLGYAEAQNQGEGPYPNTSAVGVNIKSDTPEPLNILSIQEIYR